MGRKLLPLEGRRILIVEDDYLTAADMAETVIDAGGEVVGPASSAQMSSWLVDQDDFDVALLDVRLADSDATEVARTLVARDVPFIVVTGYSRDSLSDELHAAPFLGKPVHRKELVAMLADRLAIARHYPV